MNKRTGERNFTQLVYSYIKEHNFREVIVICNDQLLNDPDNRAALSLMGYCLYQTQDFVGASDCYEKLSARYPDNNGYKLYFAQSLYKAELFSAAMKVACQLDDVGNKETSKNLNLLKAAINYGEKEYNASINMIEKCPKGDISTLINMGCIHYNKSEYDKALEYFQKAYQLDKNRPTLLYNLAVCSYKLNSYAAALKFVADVIEKGIHEHPELGVGMITEGLEVRSVGNTLMLHETALVEAFNLKAAIEFKLKNVRAASEALTDMPPRMEEELDPVTLHNQALINMNSDPAGGFKKLQFLIQQGSFPAEAFANLLLLYIKYEYFDLAADVLAENGHFVQEFLTPSLREFLEAVILRQNAPEDAFQRLDALVSRQTDKLRRLTKLVQNARNTHNEEQVKQTVNEFDECLEEFITVLMQQAKIYWDRENYKQVEKIFRKSVEFCNDHDVWKLNVAHVLFMQENKYKEAAIFYAPIVKQHFDNLLDISAVILANLCVTYIMTGQNEDAEDLMRKIEKEEEALAYEGNDKKSFHLCIVNLVIGTLYCAKGNYDFGISRVMKSLQPHNKKLGPDTWYYTKRCFLSMIENLAKHMILVSDTVKQECVHFLEQCELFGRDVSTLTEQPLNVTRAHPGENTVTFEARVLKSLLLQLIHPV